MVSIHVRKFMNTFRNTSANDASDDTIVRGYSPMRGVASGQGIPQAVAQLSGNSPIQLHLQKRIYMFMKNSSYSLTKISIF